LLKRNANLLRSKALNYLANIKEDETKRLGLRLGWVLGFAVIRFRLNMFTTYLFECQLAK